MKYGNYNQDTADHGDANNGQTHERLPNFLLPGSFAEQDYFEWARLIWIVFSPIIIVMGVVGNIMVVLVLRRRMFRHSSAALILRCLALADSAMLLLSCLPRLVAFVLRVDLHEIYDATCRGEYITTYFLTDLASWVLVLVTMERAVAVVLPLKSKAIITRKVTMITLTVITLAFFALNLPIPFILHYTDGGVCEPFPQYKLVWERVMGTLNLAISSFIPFTVITIVNFVGWLTLLTNKRRCDEYRVASAQNRDPWKISSITRMLIVIDLVFLATTMPIAVFRVFFPDSMYHPDPEVRAELIFYRAICELILYCNSCANFYLYCMAGLRFRSELKLLLGMRIPWLPGAIRMENLRYNRQPTPNSRVQSSSYEHYENA